MKNYFNKPLLFVIPAIIGFSEMQAQTKEAIKEPGINTTFFDTKVKPADNFFRYVNGTWLDKTEIPSDRTSWGSFNELLKKTDADALAILKEASKNPQYKSNTDQGKAINLYSTILDTVARNKQGITPLKPYLAKIDKVKNIQDLQKLLIEMEPIGGIGFFGVGVGADDKDSSKNSLNLGVSGLGLPDKDYYTSEEKDTKEKREKYELHIARMLQFTGETPAEAKANATKVLALEKELSSPRLDRVERRDGRLQYNPMTIADLQKITPAINWKNYFDGIGFTKLDSVIVSEPKYMKALQTILAENNVSAWKEYMKWDLINSASGLLSTDIESANFDFYGKTLTGAIKQRPREDRALQTVNGTIGEALGKLYVEKMFPAEAKEKAEKMIKNIITAYQNRISNLPWMSAETKTKAIEKLNKITIKIGYPDKWKDYSKLEIKSIADGGNYLGNIKNLTKWNFQKGIDKLNEPVDKTEWYMSPQTVNAYYNPSYNEIVFPAAILQPPFYNYQADEAVNYGGIGAVIGHEISHGFDDSGARYNADGNLVDWWTAEDLTRFTALGTALADQYSALEPLPGVHVDGKFTLGENIGDLGGVNAAYDGLQLYLKENKNPGLIDGFTPEQRFFISWATVWRTKMRDEAIKNQVKTDPHSPGMYRAYVPVQNVDAFYQAFDIKKGDGMFIEPEKRVKIW
ncbi:endothelin-converting enzyme/putative endopeptidase [Flavobacterium sp. 7E]|uniref:M13 family metallopeptidase n=1 Tax=unclassified Flavobacterium TaxID=196869 RepID=UPI00157142A5|nr:MULTISPECIES: M13 family metallopeptidase [unclassified Flavobacterium]NRS88018.1 endothelin-converting enzyme/putative endopeptidase [Flavobacterium sp. 7E]NRT14579.1 endothelin-converting enzyme/putative endopeptidase [Flavobacterium sp. 28A]